MDPVELRRGIGYVIQQGGLFPHRACRRQRRHRAPSARLGQGPGGRPGAASCSSWSASTPTSTAAGSPTSCRAASASGSGWPGPSGGDPPVLLMDEPFGAVDPVTRQRLQHQFLELQAELKKTIVFVTHDIEEAAKLGDRIAVLSKGGVLEQYDTPAEVLGRPATAFVADFVGADRGVRRLAVMHIEPDDLFQPPRVDPDDDDGRGPAPRPPGRTAAGPSWSTVSGSCRAGSTSSRARTARSSEHLVPFEVQVPLGTSLRAAFGRDAPARRALDPGGRRTSATSGS